MRLLVVCGSAVAVAHRRPQQLPIRRQLFPFNSWVSLDLSLQPPLSKVSGIGTGIRSDRSMERPSGFDDDDDDEEFGGKRDGSSHKDGKNSGADQRPNTPRSKHSATEQRRRSKINDRFQILRELIPHSDQKRDKASFLLEVIEYVRFLQEKAQKYESSYPGWTEENAKLMPWNNSQGPGDGLADPSQVIKNGSAPPGFIFSGHDNSVPVPQAMVSAAHNPTESDTSAGTSYKATENSSGFVNADNLASQSQSQCLRSPCPTDFTVAGNTLNDQEELAIDEGTISVSSAYSQGMLTTLSQALQSSGIDLSQANISVIINLGKRAANRRPAVTTTMSSAKDHDDPSFGNRAIGHSTVGSSGEESEQASKRRKLENS